MPYTLYDYWRSSASYRVRIALNLKALSFDIVPVDLRTGEQRASGYRSRNPQGLVPMLDTGEGRQPLTQSLAIIDYLDSVAEPRLIPADPAARAEALSSALIVAADIHPLGNLRVLQYLKQHFAADQAALDSWCAHWISEGFAALEERAPDTGYFGGDAPNVVDVMLVPQMYNARRFHTPLGAFPKLVRIDAACCALPPVAAAVPVEPTGP